MYIHILLILYKFSHKHFIIIPNLFELKYNYIKIIKNTIFISSM